MKHSRQVMHQRNLRAAEQEPKAAPEVRPEPPSSVTLPGNQAVQRLASRAGRERAVLGARLGLGNQSLQRLARDVERAAPEEEEPVQAKSAGGERAAQTPDGSAGPSSPTGLPAPLKASVERLSGMSLDGVRVHYNSSRPAQLQALAYTQGADIHVGPGQERHLAHEAWHVVQQAQGRTGPAQRSIDGMPVNDDARLEREADQMGARATAEMAQASGAGHGGQRQAGTRQADQQTLPKATAFLKSAANSIQRKAVANVNNVGLFRDVGNGLFGSDTPVTANDVVQVVNAIRTSDQTTGQRTNIRILTGTHGTPEGHLVGEPIFYQEDLANEGHQAQSSGWVNVLKVEQKSKSTIAGWKDGRSNSAVILAWCYSARSEANWPNVHASWDGGATWAW
jgi:hypothetical protein